MTERMTILQNQTCSRIVHNFKQKSMRMQGSLLQPTSTLSPPPAIYTTTQTRNYVSH